MVIYIIIILNKIQFTFEVVPCLILGLFKRFFKRCASILAQHYKGGKEGRVGGWQKTPCQVKSLKTRGHAPVALRWS